MRWRVGDLIDNRYEIYRILKGGIGIVYICVNQKTGAPLAVKTFQDKYLSDEATRKRFVREADTWIRLEKHRNVVKAYGVKILSGKPYILLEYVPSSNDGKATLRDYILGLNIVKALNFAIQICIGMVYVTTKVKNLVHRDIKPENIMVTPDRIGKITDFGLVKALGTLKAENPMGTPEYMSPEQFRTMNVDTQSDIYSFNTVLYEMLTGQSPFYTTLQDPVERWRFYEYNHINTVPRNPRSLNHNIHESLDELVMKGIEKKPKNRYRSFEDLRKALDDIYFEISGKHVPVNTGPPSEAWELSNKGNSLVELGRIDEGIAILNQAIQLDPKYAGAHVNLGVAYGRKGWLDQAITELSRAVELDPNNISAHINLGKSYDEKGWLDQAITEHQKVIQIEPEYGLAHYNLGDTYGRKGLIDKAITELRRAIELDPNLFEAHNDLGFAYFLKGWLDQAIIEYKRAIELNPNYSKTHSNLGNVYSQRGLFEQAIFEYKRAIELDSNLPVTHFNLATAYFNSGRFDLAWKHVRIAEKLGISTKNIVQLVDELRTVSREP